MYTVYLNAEQTYLFQRLTRIDSGRVFYFETRENGAFSLAPLCERYSAIFGWSG